MRARTALAITLLGSSVASAALCGQTSEQKLTFEVASIKEHPFTPGSMVGTDFQPGGRFLATTAPLDLLIMSAYDLLPTQLQFPPELPDALKTMYDIEAKAPQGTIPPGRLSRDSETKMALMLRELLAERFKLRLHVEKKNCRSMRCWLKKAA